MLKRLLLAAIALAASASVALGQGPGPGPTPNPWGQSGSTLYYNNGGLVLPSTVTGGSKGVGTINVQGIYINGTAILTPALASGAIWVGSGSNVATPQIMSGDCTLSIGGVITCPAARSITAGTTTIGGTTHANGLFYNSGNVFTNLTTAASGVLVTSAGSVPSISTTLPNGLAMGTPASLVLTSATGLPLGGHAAQTANTVIGNGTGSSAVPTALAVPSCSGASNGLIWISDTGFGCNTFTASGIVNSGTANQLAYYATSTNAVSTTSAIPNGITATTQSPGDSSAKVATNAYVDAAIAAALTVPAGTVAPYAGSAAPTGWILCFGQSVLRADFPALFTAIGTTFGAVDGTHFTLPDLRGRAVFGVDNMGGSAANRLGSGATGGVTGAATLAAAGGQQSHTMTSGELVAHTHGAGSYIVDPTIATEAGGNANWNGGTGSTTGGSSVAVSGTSGSAGSTTPFNVTPPVLVLNYIIKQ